jgi:hypothetical protein
MSKKVNFFAKFFVGKIFKIITSVPDRQWNALSSFCSLPSFEYGADGGSSGIGIQSLDKKLVSGLAQTVPGSPKDSR